MNLNLARKAVVLYPHRDYIPRDITNSLRRKWIKQITYLGDNWILAKQVKRK